MIQTSGELRRENVDSCLSTVIASETKQSRAMTEVWIASAYAQERFGGLPPGEARAASIDGSSLRSSQ